MWFTLAVYSQPREGAGVGTAGVVGGKRDSFAGSTGYGNSPLARNSLAMSNIVLHTSLIGTSYSSRT